MMLELSDAPRKRNRGQPQSLNAEDKERILALRAQGMRQRAIAMVVGKSKSVVARWLKEVGV